MARFTLADDRLYILNRQQLTTYTIQNSQNPVKVGQTTLYTEAETIFPFGNYLLMGSSNGLYIYDRLSNPDQPGYISQYTHWFSCDPIVAQGTIAYATLRSGTTCRNGLNALDVVDISDWTNPKLLKSYSMRNPHGLGIDGNLLFVCEGEFGLKVFDATDPLDLQQIQYFDNVDSYDVIPQHNLLIVTGKEGIYQYRYGSGNTLKLLSKLAVQP